MPLKLIILFIKNNGKFYKKIISGDCIPQLFEVRGDAKFSFFGDVNKLMLGTDNTINLEKFISTRKKTVSIGNHVGVSTDYFPQPFYEISVSNNVKDNNTATAL